MDAIYVGEKIIRGNELCAQADASVCREPKPTLTLGKCVSVSGVLNNASK